MKKLSGILGIAFLVTAGAYVGVIVMVCDGKKIACMDFSANHPVIALLILSGSALSAVSVFSDQS